MPGGLEGLASDFARDLSSAAGHAGDIGEGALGDLRNILADTLARIRDEVFTGPGDRAGDDGREPDQGDGDTRAAADDEAGPAAEPRETGAGADGPGSEPGAGSGEDRPTA
jgi:hypothetical protein